MSAAEPVTHYRKRKEGSGAAGAPVGGPLCGDRQEGDSLAKAWATVDCARCVDLRHAPPPPEAPAEPAEVEAPWRDPASMPPELVALCKMPAFALCSRLGKVPPEPAIEAWASQTAVVLDHYLGALPSHPLTAWALASAMLALAIYQAPAVAPEPAP